LCRRINWHELVKIITCKQDSAVTLKFNTIPAPVTRGNTYKIRQDQVRYDLRKFSFSNGVRTLWNSLPDVVVKAESVNTFKKRLDRFWDNQELKFNWKADIKGNGSRSNVNFIYNITFYASICHYTGH